MTSQEREQAIQESRAYLGYSVNWDDDGGIPPTEETWQRMADWLRSLPDVPIPAIMLCDDGSFDLDWLQPLFELLVNIPAAPQPITCYGDDGHRGAIVRDINDVTAWLRGKAA